MAAWADERLGYRDAETVKPIPEMKKGKCAIWKPINLPWYLQSTSGKLHAPQDAKCRGRQKSYLGSYKFPPKQTGKKKAHTEAKAKVKDKGHETPSARVDDSAVPFVTNGCEVQEVQARRDLGLYCAHTHHYRKPWKPEEGSGS